MEPVVITGFSFRLPQGAEDEATFWSLLEKGKNVMTEWPESRANIHGLFAQDRNLKNTVCVFQPSSERTTKDTTLTCDINLNPRYLRWVATF